ncbi:MAG: malonyl-ACP O-methyltransferase BioC [Candidatus Margulisbacteria bacterium]|nr:malonyl-ACP O-methyltransferase BioC [Candidatus Margulisiibacteriota bacterium]MBU1021206.1 malonyl-ACP O-methyltransferase BioC [Candidatus Margulisiibacteriota bacterium]MBU1729812.1 malonyl-ACP O-methyltransferase BioC [Candidatus Margulisiibacteriota bacterium]MBU1955313.1 malonyl-ACP O-methyltransferase BioC [Candidatus Margulisiibacteriota bacterium]
MDKETIQKNFSKSAAHYDNYANIQKLVASELLTKLDGTGYSNILEIGCGTGIYTSLLQNRFPQAQIRAIDFSPEMTNIAKAKLDNIKFITTDGELAILDESFDLISSNACFQWFEDLKAALARYKFMLEKDGALLFSIFGPLTYFELHASLQELSKKKLPLAASAFIDKDELIELLGETFSDFTIEEKIITEKHPTLKSLLSKIKYTGTRGNGIEGQPLGPMALRKLEKIYKSNFKKITASHHIFYCKAKK